MVGNVGTVGTRVGPTDYCGMPRCVVAGIWLPIHTYLKTFPIDLNSDLSSIPT